MIQFGNQMIQIDRPWNKFVRVIDGTEKRLRLQCEEVANGHQLFALDQGVVYTCMLYAEGLEPDGLSEAELTVNAEGREAFDALYHAKCNHQLAQFDADGNMAIVLEGAGGDKYTVISHNWCDPCTWFQTSVQVTNERLVDLLHASSSSSSTEAEEEEEVAAGTVFVSQHPFWIDLAHGRQSYEDSHMKAAGDKYKPRVTKSGVLLTEDVDYVVDYERGRVTLTQAAPRRAIRATYCYATDGVFTIKPPANKKLKLDIVEVQFSKNIVLKDIMTFQMYGYAAVFRPDLVASEEKGPYDLVEVNEPIVYKHMRDYINESNGSRPLIPACGGEERGTKDDVVVYVWDYLSRTKIHSKYGMELRVCTKNAIPHEGEMAIGTFYNLIEED